MVDDRRPRPYSSPRRERAARATRRAVLAAARRLFVTKGYTAATIDEIAAAAEVSRPTVFAVGSKPELLRLVHERAIAGDADRDRDGTPVTAGPDATDAQTTLRRHAHTIVRVAARAADIDEVLHQAADAHPELQALWEASERQRLRDAERIVDDVAHVGRLKPGVDRGRAIDILWLLMAPDQLRRMRERGWNDAAYETWLGDTLITQLLA